MTTKMTTRDRGIDLFILVLNVMAIMVLVGILSVMVNSAEAKQSSGQPGQQAAITATTHD